MKDNVAIDDSVIDHYRSKFDWAGGKGLITVRDIHPCMAYVTTTFCLAQNVAWAGVSVKPIMFPENDKRSRSQLRADWMARGVWEESWVELF